MKMKVSKHLEQCDTVEELNLLSDGHPTPAVAEIRHVGASSVDNGRKWEHDKWELFLDDEVFEYRTGTGHRKNGKPVRPPLADILHSLVMDAGLCDQSFSDFCDDLGYSDDSIKALNLYRKTEEQTKRLRKVLGRTCMNHLRELLAAY